METEGFDSTLESKTAAIPGTQADTSVTVTVKFKVACADDEITGVGVKSTALEAQVGGEVAGTGVVTCIGDAIVTFDPVPLEVPEGSTKKVTVTVTKLASLPEVNNKKVHLRLIQPGGGTFGGDVLLDTKDVPAPGARKLLRKITVTTTFTIECTNNEIRRQARRHRH